MLNHLDLFSGVGGFSLGLERTGGFRTTAFCEIAEHPSHVLKRHWPSVKCYSDVKELTAARLQEDDIKVDVITGGFPCQDISFAGPGKGGIDGERSGLWHEYARLIGEIRPRYIVVENVAALLVRGIDRVLGTLASFGYDAEWNCIPASHLGAPHGRDRIWIIAYPSGLRYRRRPEQHFSKPRIITPPKPSLASSQGDAPGHVSDPDNAEGRRQLKKRKPGGRDAHVAGDGAEGGAPHPDGEGLEIIFNSLQRQLQAALRDNEWTAEPGVCGVAYGVSNRVDRIGELGNAIVPKMAEMIGNAILEHAESWHPAGPFKIGV